VSDTVAVALITGGLTGITGLVSGLLGYRSARNQGAVTLSVANQTAGVELQKIKAENDRLREQRRAEATEKRMGSYQELVDISTKLYRLFGEAVEKARIEPLVEQYNWLLAGLLLYAPDEVQDRAYELNGVIGDAWTAFEEDPSQSESERWRLASMPFEKALGKAVNELGYAMRTDVQSPAESD
jgi:hypothetical protein